MSTEPMNCHMKIYDQFSFRFRSFLFNEFFVECECESPHWLGQHGTWSWDANGLRFSFISVIVAVLELSRVPESVCVCSRLNCFHARIAHFHNYLFRRRWGRLCNSHGHHRQLSSCSTDRRIVRYRESLCRAIKIAFIFRQITFRCTSYVFASLCFVFVSLYFIWFFCLRFNGNHFFSPFVWWKFGQWCFCVHYRCFLRYVWRVKESKTTYRRKGH